MLKRGKNRNCHEFGVKIFFNGSKSVRLSEVGPERTENGSNEPKSALMIQIDSKSALMNQIDPKSVLVNQNELKFDENQTNAIKIKSNYIAISCKWCIAGHKKMKLWCRDQWCRQANQIIVHIWRVPQRRGAYWHNGWDECVDLCEAWILLNKKFD